MQTDARGGNLFSTPLFFAPPGDNSNKGRSRRSIKGPETEDEVMAVRIDTMGAIVSGRENDRKARPEVRETRAPEKPTPSQRSVRFQKHQGAGRWMAEVVDIYNNEVIREIPNRKALDVVGEMKHQLGKIQDFRA